MRNVTTTTNNTHNVDLQTLLACVQETHADLVHNCVDWGHRGEETRNSCQTREGRPTLLGKRRESIQKEGVLNATLYRIHRWNCDPGWEIMHELSSWG